MKKFVLILVLLTTPAYSLEKNDVVKFLGDKTTAEVQQKFLNAIDENDKASSCLVEHGEFVYSLCGLPVQKDKNPKIQSSLMSAKLEQASMRAALNLAMYLDDGTTKSIRFENKDAFNHVIMTAYQAKVKFGFAKRVVNGTAYALAKAKRVKLNLSENDVNKSYCEFLYEQAHKLFNDGKFLEALKTFHQIHYLAWANVSAYLGASVCFVKMNQNDDAIKLTSELISVFSKDMTADEMANAGKILFVAGEKDGGFNALEQAYKMLKTKFQEVQK